MLDFTTTGNSSQTFDVPVYKNESQHVKQYLWIFLLAACKTWLEIKSYKTFQKRMLWMKCSLLDEHDVMNLISIWLNTENIFNNETVYPIFFLNPSLLCVICILSQRQSWSQVSFISFQQVFSPLTVNSIMIHFITKSLSVSLDKLSEEPEPVMWLAHSDRSSSQSSDSALL